MITEGQRFRRYVVVILWGISAAVLAIIYVRHIAIIQYQGRYQSQAFSPSPSENQVNGLTYYRYDPNTNRLCFMASASSLRAENAILGIFRTAAAKSIKIKDLRLFFSDCPFVSALESLQTLALTETTNPDKNILGRFANTGHKWNMDIDLSNAREATINNFNCRIFNKNDLQLGIQSRRAAINSDWPRITLRGHVIVTGPDGGTLESNHVKWDIQKQTFTAEGMYILKHGASQITGENICVDSFLNIADTKNARK